jgi:hypothetical protein
LEKDLAEIESKNNQILTELNKQHEIELNDLEDQNRDELSKKEV